MGDVGFPRRTAPLVNPVVTYLYRQGEAAVRRHAWNQAQAYFQQAVDYKPPPMPYKPKLRGSVKKTNKKRVYVRSGKIQRFKAPKYILNEIKNKDGTVPTYASTNDIELINGIAQGDTESTRDGRYILPQRLEFNFRAIYPASSGDLVMRVLCVVDTMPDGTAPAVTDVLTTAQPQAFYNLDNASRFRICMDRLWYEPEQSVTNARTIEKHFSCDVSRCGPVAYADNGSTVTSIVKGACYLIYLGTITQSTDTDYRYTFVDQ